MTTMSTAMFSEYHARQFALRGLTPLDVAQHGGMPCYVAGDLPEGAPKYWVEHLPGVVYRTGDSWQLKPDVPAAPAPGKPGEPAKYLFAPGGSAGLYEVLVRPHRPRIVIVEGTHQAMAVAKYAPPDVSVYGLAGCWGWSQQGAPAPGLYALAGRDVTVLFDADCASNPHVYKAAKALADVLSTAVGARSVMFASTPGTGKAGIDDVLGSAPEDARAGLISRMLDGKALIAPAKLKRPAPKPAKAQAASTSAVTAADEGPSRFFDADGLLPQALTQAILEDKNLALTDSNEFAVFGSRGYTVEPCAVELAGVKLLGNKFRASMEKTYVRTTQFALMEQGRIIKNTFVGGDLPVANGLLDIGTGALAPHTPEYLSLSRLSVEYDPAAECPTYDKWIVDCVGSDNVAVLESAASAMLALGQTGKKALILTGPSRSGKSTFLELMQAVIGRTHVSQESISQLSKDKFSPAQLHNKVLNVCADIESGHLRDISMFKQLTGGDTISAQHKNQKGFTFKNTALMMFSANELPQTSESSRAFLARCIMVEFPNSFIGKEDPSILAKLKAELPGIFNRLLRAYRASLVDGHHVAMRPSELAEERLARATDRFREFFAQTCKIGDRRDEVTGVRAIRLAFNRWAEAQGGYPLGEKVIRERLAKIEGIRRVERQVDGAKLKGWTLAILPEDEWSDGDVYELELDPVVEPAEVEPAEVEPAEVEPAEVEPAEVEPAEVRAPHYRSVPQTVDTVPIEDRPGIFAGREYGWLPPVDLDTGSPADRAIDTVLAQLGIPEYVSRCELGHAEALVDGAWYACPQCEPATVYREP
jgi:putative DNA primase/helicase